MSKQIKISYSITGTLTVDEDTYKEYAEDGDEVWNKLTPERQKELVEECEDENDNEVILEHAIENGKVKLTIEL